MARGFIVFRSMRDRGVAYREARRKSLHVFGLTAILAYWYFDKVIAILFIAGCLLVSVLIEMVRLRSYALYPFKAVVEAIARPHEVRALAAHVYFFAGALIVTFICSKEATIIAIGTSIIGDASAAIVGTLIGRRKWPFNPRKSIEGSVACFITSLLSSFLLTQAMHVYRLDLSAFYTASAALTMTLTDAPRLPVDDNFLAPIAVGLALTIMEAILSLY